MPPRHPARPAAILLLPALVLCAAAAPVPALDADGPRALAQFLTAAVNRGDVPGVVVLVAAPDRILFHEAFGKMNSARAVPMRKDAIFRIASMTKPVTSVAVMTLVEQGKLSLDDEIAQYLLAFKNPRVIHRLDLAARSYQTRPATRPITVRHLFTHTSGIGYSWSDPGLSLAEQSTGNASVSALPLVHDPGEKWTYGASPKLLGDIAEKITGLPIADFLAGRIFRPLAMADTGYDVPAPNHPRVVTLHNRSNGKTTETPNPQSLAVEPRGDGRLFSTAADYARFIQMMLNNGQLGGVRILKPETVAALGRDHTSPVKVRLQPVVRADYSQPYPRGAGEDVWGLGFQLANPSRPHPYKRRPGSMSWAGINNTFFWIDPQARIGVIVLMQMLPFYDESALAVLDGVESRVYRHLLPAAP